MRSIFRQQILAPAAPARVELALVIVLCSPKSRLLLILFNSRQVLYYNALVQEAALSEWALEVPAVECRWVYVVVMFFKLWVLDLKQVLCAEHLQATIFRCSARKLFN
jgi:hypothetical protein